MITQATTFVVGAGASFEYGLPLGADLKKNILSAVNFKTDISLTTDDAILLRALNEEPITNPARLVDGGLVLAQHAFPYDSIDEALHAFTGNDSVIQIGKLAIASQILGGERRSTLFDKERLGPTRISHIGGWLPRLFSLAVNGLPRARIRLSLRKFDETMIDIAPWTCSTLFERAWTAINQAVS